MCPPPKVKEETGFWLSARTGGNILRQPTPDPLRRVGAARRACRWTAGRPKNSLPQFLHYWAEVFSTGFCRPRASAQALRAEARDEARPYGVTVNAHKPPAREH